MELPTAKRPRLTLHEPNRGDHTVLPQSTDVKIRTFVDMCVKHDGDPCIIGDGSRRHHLPTIDGQHKDLQTISPKTVSQIVNNNA